MALSWDCNECTLCLYHDDLLQATNRKTLAAMVHEMNKGGKLLWVAPSGGRDRPDPSGQTLLGALPVKFVWGCRVIGWHMPRCCKRVATAGRELSAKRIVADVVQALSCTAAANTTSDHKPSGSHHMAKWVQDVSGCAGCRMVPACLTCCCAAGHGLQHC